MSTVSPARAVAYVVVRRVFEDGAYADRALHAEASRAGVTGRDRALAGRIAYGAVQRRALLDYVAEKLASRPAARLDPPVLAALRLGLEQLLFLDAVPAYAAVGESVELAKGASPGGARLVNAVLRRAAREGKGIVDALDDVTPRRAALLHSHPRWVAELWWEQLGPEEARALMRANNERAELALRANPLVAGCDALGGEAPGEGVAARDAVLAELRAAGVDARAADLPPDALLVEGAFDVDASALHARGALVAQSRASTMVAHVVAPRSGERVLDLCAAPGGKTTHLAALMGGQGEVVAVERHRGRAQSLVESCRRLRAANVAVRVQDGREPVAGAPFDRVLVDPPCSGLGTLRSRPDLRWRVGPRDVAELAVQQRELLTAGAAATRPGGALVYSTCTICPEENERLLERFLADEPAFAAEDLRSDVPLWHHPLVPFYLQTLPHRDGTDGFFIARLRRRP